MKAVKTRSIKQASFYGMVGGSLVYVLVSFLISCIFAITIAYLLISSHEENLAKLLTNSLQEKMQRVNDIATNLSDVMAISTSEVEKDLYLARSIKNVKDIDGVLVLDGNGIITNATVGYKDFIGIDFSGKDYFKQLSLDNSKRYYIPTSYISYKTKQVTLNVVSPIINHSKLEGMVVMIISPNLIKNDSLSGLNYYLVDSNGDIIFESYNGNLTAKEDNIKDSRIMKDGLETKKALFYRDSVQNKLMLGSIIKDDVVTNKYILVEYDVLNNSTFFKGLAILFVVSLTFIFIIILLFSSEVASVVTKYINVFKNQVKNISTGNYDIELAGSYPHIEINEIINSFTTMAHKIKQREEELQAYNEELIAANDEIRNMIASINKNEKEKKEQYLQIIWTMVNLLEIKDEYTAGHSRAVTYYTEKIAERLNEDYGFELDIERIQMAASLHDIGKIGISEEILNKAGKLTKEEYEIIKSHPSKGYYALKDIESLKEERKIIKYHHERYDGNGYPEGIKGDNIPFGARIICAADAFDAMISDRPYRKGMPLEKAIEELIKNKGTQFDSLIVDVLVDIIRSEEQALEQTEAQSIS